MITIFTPSFADEANTNAQNLTAKEVISRLPADRFRVMLLGEGEPDPRIRARKNTEILGCSRHGNTARWLTRVLLSKIDIYFFPREGPLDALFLSCRRLMRLPIALVTNVQMAHDEISPSPTMSRAIREAEEVVGNSRYVAQTVTDRFEVATRTIYDGIKRELFHSSLVARRPQSNLTVLYAGSFQVRKRVNVVIGEASKWPSVQFRLVGKGEEEENCRSLVRDLGCRNVTFVGHLSQKGLAEEMQRADVFFFPSILEGHPQVLGQAASCGLPAVAMNKYRPDYVINGETGYLVESDNELSQKLGALLSDQTLRRKMSTAAAQHAAQFDWDKVTQDWQSVFLDAVGKRRRKS